MTDETDYFGTPESRDRDARFVGHEVGPDRLGGMSFDAAIPVLTALRKSLYSEGAKRNSEVVALNTVLHMIPHLLAERDALEAENQRLRDALQQVEENAGTTYWLSQLKRPHLLRIIAVIRGIARAALKGDRHD